LNLLLSTLRKHIKLTRGANSVVCARTLKLCLNCNGSSQVGLMGMKIRAHIRLCRMAINVLSQGQAGSESAMVTFG